MSDVPEKYDGVAVATRKLAHTQWRVDRASYESLRNYARQERDAAEARIAALEEALRLVKAEASGPREQYVRNGPTWTGKDGHEYEDTSAFLDKCDAITAIVDRALLDAKP